MDSRGWNDIAYSFLVDDDGTIYEGRGVGVAGGHTAGDNTRSHAACLMGNFEARQPTDAAVDSLVWLARRGLDDRWWVPTCGGHRDAPGAGTACPGRFLYARLPEVRARVASDPEEDFDMTEAEAEAMFRRVLNDYIPTELKPETVKEWVRLGVNAAARNTEGPTLGGKLTVITDAVLPAES
jgi:hypothetical protein